MEIELTVTESQYHAILMWDDDGGAARNVIYRIIPDTTHTTPIKPPERGNPERGAQVYLPHDEAAPLAAQR
jgi:hypothetical protein